MAHKQVRCLFLPVQGPNCTAMEDARLTRKGEGIGIGFQNDRKKSQNCFKNQEKCRRKSVLDKKLLCCTSGSPNTWEAYLKMSMPRNCYIKALKSAL